MFHKFRDLYIKIKTFSFYTNKFYWSVSTNSRFISRESLYNLIHSALAIDAAAFKTITGQQNLDIFNTVIQIILNNGCATEHIVKYIDTIIQIISNKNIIIDFIATDRNHH